MKRMSTLALGAAALFSAATAQANVIDFTSSGWATASGESHVVGSVTATALAPDHATLSYSGSAGLGVDSHCFRDLYGCFDQGDEIDFLEMLRVDFDESVFVDHFTVSNLYVEGVTLPGQISFLSSRGEDQGGLFDGYREEGRYSIDGGENWIEFEADDTTGLKDVAIGERIDSILFGAVRFGPFSALSHEYSVKSVALTEVPEPMSLALLGTGLLGIGAARRRRT